MSRPRLKESWICDGGQLPFVRAAEELINHMEIDGGNEDRAEKYVQWVFESVMTELYGEEMWEWYRDKQG